MWLYCPLANYWCDVLGRYLQVEFSFFGKSFRVYCVYAPNRNPAQDQFFDDLHSKIDPSIPRVLCGDLNKVFDRSLDRAGRGPSIFLRDSSSLLKYLFKDYSDLFSASLVDARIQADPPGNLSSSLTGDQSSLCEGHLSVDEVLSALRGMARRKAPGLDGPPMEFYLKFWSVLGSDLVSVLHSCLNSGSLSLSLSLSLSTEVSFPCLLRLIQSPLFGGFSVVNMQYKVWALLSQLVRRLASSSTGWSSLVTFWFGSSFRVFPSVVFSRPFSFDPRVLLPFYSSLLLA